MPALLFAIKYWSICQFSQISSSQFHHHNKVSDILSKSSRQYVAFMSLILNRYE
ncbi:hypothetical protein [Moraxella nonliquefaciens]|uniref:hypothetical protein n=1 Tax=Moraxella nonliquefaciens TaxID=478 RepID=UPI0012E7C103|nr:hypothetical protein [Moraxella nonliquefaciens]